MGYLHPPPGDAPVIVMKDVGGDVREYSAMTTAYIRTGREVRLHECRSACTLALAVPNVCVYPDGVLRFHKAYNPITRATNEDVSNAMLSAYPPAVRQRLGLLTRQYTSLTGSELIRLGVRDCNAPAQPRILMARAIPRAGPAENPLSNAFGGLLSGLGSTPIPAYSGYGAPVQVQRVSRFSTIRSPRLADKVQLAESRAAARRNSATPTRPPPRPPSSRRSRRRARRNSPRRPHKPPTAKTRPPVVPERRSEPPPEPPFRSARPRRAALGEGFALGRADQRRRPRCWRPRGSRPSPIA